MSKLKTITSCLLAQHHSLSCTSLLNAAETLATKQHTQQNSYLCSGLEVVHIVTFRSRECAALQAFHKFVTAYCHGTEILTEEDILSCSSLPLQPPKKLSDSKHVRSFLPKLREFLD